MSSSASVTVHPTALIDPAAQLGDGSSVGPYSIVGPQVVLGKNTVIGPHVVIEGRTRGGDGNRFFQFCSVGAIPQDLKYRGEPSELILGSNNIIREYVTLQPGTSGGGMLTKIGDSNLFMANSHVGHDSIVGNRCIFANSTGLSGHVTLGNGVVVGGLSGIHQFVRIGDMAMIGGGAMVTQDIPPFCMAQGDRAILMGLNHVGLERNGFSREDILLLRKAYRTVFQPDTPELKIMGFKDRVETAAALVGNNPRVVPFTGFLRGSSRGVARHRPSRSDGEAAD